jgi:lysophospholipase L1-like esterase
MNIAMKRTLLLALLAMVVVAFVYFYMGSSVPIRNYPSTGTDIIAYGDSLVWGQGADQNKDFVSLLSQKIGQPIVNLGIPGNTTQDGLNRLNGLDIYHPKVILLLLGGNDYLKRVPIDGTFSNLGKIIEAMQKRGAIVLLLGVRGGVIEDHFDSRYKALSEKYGTAYVPDVLAGLFGNEKLMSDEVHPNNAGYQIIADRIYPVLAPLVK